MEMTFSENALVDKSSSRLENIHIVTTYFEDYMDNILFLHIAR